MTEKTKLILRSVEAAAVHGGIALALFDQNGQMIPNQVAISVEIASGGIPQIVARFSVDGDHVSIEHKP